MDTQTYRQNTRTSCAGCRKRNICGGSRFCTRRAADHIVLALATPHSLEVYAAAYAVLWGVVTSIFWHYLEHPTTAGLLSYVAGHGWAIGMWPVVWGSLGLWAIRHSNRTLRACSAAMNAMYWWALAGWFFFSTEPVITSAVVAYGAAAAAEAWVYVRVSQQFDDLVRDVRSHHGGSRRARDHTRGD